MKRSDGPILEQRQIFTKAIMNLQAANIIVNLGYCVADKFNY